VENGIMAAPVGTKFCRACKSHLPSDRFERTYRNVYTMEQRTIACGVCLSCADKLAIHSLKNNHAIRLEMGREKMVVVEKLRAKNCDGCSTECPFDFSHVEEQLRLMKLTDEDVLKRFMSIFEWDHNDPWIKSLDVCNITNKAKRLKEIRKCTLRCTFCHRLKTCKHGEGGRGKGSQVRKIITRQKMLDYLELKHDRLDGPRNNGDCLGIDDDNPCALLVCFAIFKTAIVPKEFHSDLKPYQLFVLLYDWDHDDLSQKS
jgi:hypothetical protein